MDNYGWNQNQNPYGGPYSPPPPGPPMPTHSHGFEIASLVLGVLGIFSASCGMGIMFGALAIIFGLLSKGGTMQTAPTGKIGIILGIISITFTVALTVFSIVILIQQFGGLENFITQYTEMYNALNEGDINEAYRILYGSQMPTP